ncbi:diguanylate cyclase domain-containing protein [Niveibacterium terrae]|uniref:diguanylate cyclase domain-containing protein n=1 Tax=Niveibacterium terrae TaxID=3373598 RepID=UPI003A8CD913
MKRPGFPLLVTVFATLLAVALLAWLLVAGGKGERRLVTVGLYENAPKIYTAGNGRPAGLFVELLDAMARLEGWKLRYVRCAWADCLKQVERGELDLMPDVAFSVERTQHYDFHRISVTSQWSQVYCAPRLKVLSLADLAGKRVAILEGGIQKPLFDNLMASENLRYRPILVSTFDQGFAAVMAGEADAVATNSLFAAYNGRKYKLLETPIIFRPSNLYFATGKGRNADLLRRIDAHLADWRIDADSIYFEALHRAMAASPEMLVPHWMMWSLLGLGGSLLLLGSLSLLLRRQVGQRTRALETITRELESQRADLEHLAHYDVLTDLPNRALFFGHVEQGFAEAKRNASRLALIFIDLDRFKPINDRFGHAVGDRVLQQAARRMSECIRASDTVGRIGGDEFVVLLRDISCAEDAARVAEKIRAALSQPMSVDELELSLSASLGIAVYPEHGEDEGEIAKNADRAMYYAKDRGGNQVKVFDPAMPPACPLGA